MLCFFPNQRLKNINLWQAPFAFLHGRTEYHKKAKGLTHVRRASG
jgi:hypothetical protein